MSPKEQWSRGFVLLGLSLRLLFCLNISTIFLTSVSVLKQRTEAKCLMKRARGKGRAKDLGRRTWEGTREKGQVTGSHIRKKPFENMSWRRKFGDPRKFPEASFGALGVRHATQKYACYSFSGI